MIINRRSLIAAGAGASALAAGGVAFNAESLSKKTPRYAVALYDGRLSASGQFAAGMRELGAALIDICNENENLWKTVRQIKNAAGPVAGLTSWSDYIAIRGFLESAGKRIRYESRASAIVGDRPTPFNWIMS